MLLSEGELWQKAGYLVAYGHVQPSEIRAMARSEFDGWIEAVNYWLKLQVDAYREALDEMRR